MRVGDKERKVKDLAGAVALTWFENHLRYLRHPTTLAGVGLIGTGGIAYASDQSEVDYASNQSKREGSSLGLNLLTGIGLTGVGMLSLAFAGIKTDPKVPKAIRDKIRLSEAGYVPKFTEAERNHPAVLNHLTAKKQIRADFKKHTLLSARRYLEAVEPFRNFDNPGSKGRKQYRPIQSPQYVDMLMRRLNTLHERKSLDKYGEGRNLINWAVDTVFSLYSKDNENPVDMINIINKFTDLNAELLRSIEDIQPLFGPNVIDEYAFPISPEVIEHLRKIENRSSIVYEEVKNKVDLNSRDRMLGGLSSDDINLLIETAHVRQTGTDLSGLVYVRGSLYEEFDDAMRKIGKRDEKARRRPTKEETDLEIRHRSIAEYNKISNEELPMYRKSAIAMDEYLKRNHPEDDINDPGFTRNIRELRDFIRDFGYDVEGMSELFQDPSKLIHMLYDFISNPKVKVKLEELSYPIDFEDYELTEKLETLFNANKQQTEELNRIRPGTPDAALANEKLAEATIVYDNYVTQTQAGKKTITGYQYAEIAYHAFIDYARRQSQILVDLPGGAGGRGAKVPKFQVRHWWLDRELIREHYIRELVAIEAGHITAGELEDKSRKLWELYHLNSNSGSLPRNSELVSDLYALMNGSFTIDQLKSKYIEEPNIIKNLQAIEGELGRTPHNVIPNTMQSKRITAYDLLDYIRISKYDLTQAEYDEIVDKARGIRGEDTTAVAPYAEPNRGPDLMDLGEEDRISEGGLIQLRDEQGKPIMRVPTQGAQGGDELGIQARGRLEEEVSELESKYESVLGSRGSPDDILDSYLRRYVEPRNLGAYKRPQNIKMPQRRPLIHVIDQL